MAVFVRNARNENFHCEGTEGMERDLAATSVPRRFAPAECLCVLRVKAFS
jgi:hypothetical protein